jgi:hypothetical protein
MNKKQKVLTVLFLLFFTLTLLWFPHADYKGEMYYFVLSDYGGDPDWFKVDFEWAWLAVIYSGLFFMLKNPKPN